MNNTIVLDFKKIISELENKNLKIGLLENSIFIEDIQKRLYVIEDYYHGGYLDRFIKDGNIITFNLVDVEISKNIGDWRKKFWVVPEIKACIKRQYL